MKNPKILIVITGWNWKEYVKPCLDSVFAQTYKNYVFSIVDDGSEDGSAKEVYDVLNDQQLPVVYGLYKSYKKNKGTIYARDFAINMAKEKGYDYNAIVLLDGDDQLLPNALERVAEQLEAGKLITYGNWLNQAGTVCPVNLKYSNQVHTERTYRKDTFRCTHLRGFTRELYERIPNWRIIQAEVDSYPDAEILFSMLEMAGRDRIGVIFEPIYIYNETNPARTLKRFGKDQEGYEEICNRPTRQLI